MNQETQKTGAGKLIGACLLAIVIAALTPITMITELMSLMVVVGLPAILTMLLYRWAGRVPATLSCMLQMVFTARMLGVTFMWMNFCTGILPLFVLIRSDHQPFFTRMKIALAGFCGGVVTAVAIMYANYGGNMIERVLSLLPQGMRTIPAEMLEMPMQTLSTALGRELTVDAFYTIFDDMIASLIPHYQLNLPGMLFSGAIITAVLCTSLGSWMRVKKGLAGADTHVPIREWYLPASTVSGVVTMVVAGYATSALGMEHGQTLYYTVYSIALTVFCIQALASASRKLHGGKMSPVGQRMMIIGFAVLALMGASLYLAIYGIASALFGEKGALRMTIENKNKQ